MSLPNRHRPLFQSLRAKTFVAMVVTVIALLIPTLLLIYRGVELRQDIGHFTDKLLPRAVAAIEMEINTVGIGLAAAKYLHSSNTEYREGFECNFADSQPHWEKFKGLAETQTQIRHAREVGGLFADFSARGRVLMAWRDESQIGRAQTRRQLQELKSHIEVASQSAEGAPELAKNECIHQLIAAIRAVEISEGQIARFFGSFPINARPVYLRDRVSRWNPHKHHTCS